MEAEVQLILDRLPQLVDQVAVAVEITWLLPLEQLGRAMLAVLEFLQLMRTAVAVVAGLVLSVLRVLLERVARVAQV